jgi:hypothetical protein
LKESENEIFDVAHLDKIIPIYDQGKEVAYDRAYFLLRTNLEKLPCVKSVEDVTPQIKDLDLSKIEYIEISNEKLLSGKYDERTVLPVLEAQGIAEKPRDLVADYKNMSDEELVQAAGPGTILPSGAIVSNHVSQE